MKKSILTAVIIFFTAQSMNAQWWNSSEKITGNKEVVKQTRNVDNYDQIYVTGMMEVELVAGKEGKINLEAESNLMKYIETEVSGGHLKISVKKGVNLQPSRNYPIKLVVPFEDLEALSLTGSGHIKTSDEIRSRDFKVSVTGSGNMNLNLVTETLSGSVTGSGDVKLKGNTNSFKGTVTGSGDILAYGLKADSVDAHVTGSGDIQITAVNELNARISGSGDISYKGNPEKLNFKTSGSGEVSRN